MNTSNTIVPYADSLMFWISENMNNPGLVAVSNCFSALVSEPVFFVFTLILYWCVDPGKSYSCCINLMLSVFVCLTLKKYFGELRPTVPHLSEVSGYSFPSTHALTGTIMFGFLSMLLENRISKILCISIVLCICFSRVILGVHYLHDVMFSLAGGLMFLFMYRQNEARICHFLSSASLVNVLIRSAVVAVIVFFAFLYGEPAEVKLSGGLAGFWAGHELRRSRDIVAGFNLSGFLIFIAGAIGVICINSGLKSLMRYFLHSSGLLWIVRYFFTFFWVSYIFPELLSKLLHKPVTSKQQQHLPDPGKH